MLRLAVYTGNEQMRTREAVALAVIEAMQRMMWDGKDAGGITAADGTHVGDWSLQLDPEEDSEGSKGGPDPTQGKAR